MALCGDERTSVGTWIWLYVCARDRLIVVGTISGYICTGNRVLNFVAGGIDYNVRK